MSAIVRRIDDILIGQRHRRRLGDIGALAASIADVGLLHPVVISPDGTLIAGERRLEAYKQLGRTDIPVTVLDIDALARGELTENAVRKDFTPSELVEISRAVEEEERRLAKARQSVGGQFKEQASAKLAQASGRTRERVAERIGTKPTTLAKARAIVEAAEADPEVFGKLVADMDRTGRVDGPYKRLKVIRQAEEIKCAPTPLPRGPFPVIVVDPPWSYEKRDANPSHRGVRPYPSMSIADLCALELPSVAAPDSVLWLWTTNHHMREAFAILDAWGFETKTVLTWAKDKMGMSDWLRGQTEHAIMAVRGKPIVTLTNQTTLLDAPVRQHSRKPDEFFALVESLCPAHAGGYVSLFERYARPGWVLWGDEAPASKMVTASTSVDDLPGFLDRRPRCAP